MNIVIEGPDGTGKSTMAIFLSQNLPLTLKNSEGPEKYAGEIIERAQRYLSMDRMIFDRHPVVGQPIYGLYREVNTELPQALVDQFYATSPLLIYCPSRKASAPHILKGHDTDDHLAMVQRWQHEIRAHYDDWAAHRKAFVYHMGENPSALLKACQEYVA